MEALHARNNSSISCQIAYTTTTKKLTGKERISLTWGCVSYSSLLLSGMSIGLTYLIFVTIELGQFQCFQKTCHMLYSIYCYPEVFEFSQPGADHSQQYVLFPDISMFEWKYRWKFSFALDKKLMLLQSRCPFTTFMPKKPDNTASSKRVVSEVDWQTIE